jgi:hypothetical protein
MRDAWDHLLRERPGLMALLILAVGVGAVMLLTSGVVPGWRT